MEEEKFIEMMVTDDLTRGVKFYHQNRELKSVKEITQKILKYDNLIIDDSRARPKPVN